MFLYIGTWKLLLYTNIHVPVITILKHKLGFPYRNLELDASHKHLSVIIIFNCKLRSTIFQPKFLSEL